MHFSWDWRATRQQISKGCTLCTPSRRGKSCPVEIWVSAARVSAIRTNITTKRRFGAYEAWLLDKEQILISIFHVDYLGGKKMKGKAGIGLKFHKKKENFLDLFFGNYWGRSQWKQVENRYDLASQYLLEGNKVHSEIREIFQHD